MKIAIVHSYYSSTLPSGENTVVDMQVRALRNAGHCVRVIDARTDELEKNTGYKIRTAVNVATGRGLDPTDRLNEFAPDVIHVHNLFPNFSTRWLKKWRGPIVSTLHNFRPVCASGLLYREGKNCTLCPDGSQVNGIMHGCYRDSGLATIPLAVRNRHGIKKDAVLERSDSIILLSERSRSQYAHLGLDDNRINIIPNFVYRPSSVNIQKLAPRKWIYVGRIAPEKGILKLVEHWPATIELHIYGDGPETDKLRKIHSNNIVYHGLVSREEVLEQMHRAQGLVIPSTCAENFPTVYAESLAAGIPVLAKSGNAAADDVEISGSGKVFHKWNELNLQVSEISHNRCGYSTAALERYESQFTEEHWIDEMTSIYGRLVNYS